MTMKEMDEGIALIDARLEEGAPLDERKLLRADRLNLVKRREVLANFLKEDGTSYGRDPWKGDAA
jgi:hypothetical protein